MIRDEIGARLVGISPSLVRRLIFALGGGLAGLVAVARAMTAPLTVTAGFDLTTFALIVAVVGGLGSVGGAFLAGVILGVVETVSAHYIGECVTAIVLLAAAAVTILVRPRGLLGTVGPQWKNLSTPAATRRRRLERRAHSLPDRGHGGDPLSVSPRLLVRRASPYTTGLAVEALAFWCCSRSAST